MAIDSAVFKRSQSSVFQTVWPSCSAESILGPSRSKTSCAWRIKPSRCCRSGKRRIGCCCCCCWCCCCCRCCRCCWRWRLGWWLTQKKSGFGLRLTSLEARFDETRSLRRQATSGGIFGLKVTKYWHYKSIREFIKLLNIMRSKGECLQVYWVRRISLLQAEKYHRMGPLVAQRARTCVSTKGTLGQNQNVVGVEANLTLRVSHNRMVLGRYV